MESGKIVVTEYISLDGVIVDPGERQESDMENSEGPFPGRSIAFPDLISSAVCKEPTMSIKTLIAIFATVTATFAPQTIVHSAHEKQTMPTATPQPIINAHRA